MPNLLYRMIGINEIERFLKSKTVLALKQEFARPAYFETLGIHRSEKVYSNILAWLLAPHESHGLGCSPMKYFLLAVRDAAREFHKVCPKCEVPSWLYKIGKYKIKKVVVKTESCVSGTKRRMDVFCQMVLSIKGHDISCQMVIENKVDSVEHDSQTEVYHRFVCEKYGKDNALFVFLTPEPIWRLEKGFAEVKCSSSAYVRLNYQLLMDKMLVPLMREMSSKDDKRRLLDIIKAMGYDKKREEVMAVPPEERKLLEAFVKEQKEFLKRIAVSLGYCQEKESLNLVGLVMNKRNRPKYSLDDGDGLSMNRIVLAVVKKYVREHETECDWDMLSKTFPKELQGTFGVVTRLTDDLYVNYRDDPTPRYFDEGDEILMLKDGTKAVVSTQWGTGGRLGERADNFNRFLKYVKKNLGYKVEKLVRK